MLPHLPTLRLDNGVAEVGLNLARPEPNPDGRIRDVEEAMSVAASVLDCRPED